MSHVFLFSDSLSLFLSFNFVLAWAMCKVIFSFSTFHLHLFVSIVTGACLMEGLLAEALRVLLQENSALKGRNVPPPPLKNKRDSARSSNISATATSICI